MVEVGFRMGLALDVENVGAWLVSLPSTCAIVGHSQRMVIEAALLRRGFEVGLGGELYQCGRRLGGGVLLV